MAHENRLIHEASPYLLQHAKNPVDWYPWGPDALELARREDKPILLSIGYAACHWCHVMERESFENEPIAAQMNKLFVNIKVDREERPDLDQIYQLVVQLMGRSGGWPLTVFLTPDQRPFFAGTYFPPADKMGMPGFPKILAAVHDAYKARRGEVETQAQEIAQAIDRVHRVPVVVGGSGAIGPDLLRRASRKLLARFDSHHGGFGSRPKFPSTMALDVMLRRGVVEGDRVCTDSVELALDRMRAGGIWDHLRGGFHRYSTDERWLVPHFEKMLYDNALLLRLYTDGYRAFGKELYASVARELVGYLFAEMRDSSGGFYSSQDADSEGHEGKFFVWTLADLRAAIGDDTQAYDVARVYFGVDEEGNFENTGATVLSETKSLARVAAILDLKEAEAAEALGRAKALMLAAREKRERPFRDDKVLASWNGLLIGALADAGRAFNEPSWVEAAAQAFAAIEEKLVEGGRVGRYYKDGALPPGGRRGFLDDQAFIGNAALDLFEATGEPRYLASARAIADAMLEHFWDKAAGGFYFTPTDGDALIARTQEIFDHAIPSSTSMASLLCLRLSELVAESYAEPGAKQLEALATPAIDNPFGLGQTVCVLDRMIRGTVDVVLVGDARSDKTRGLERVAWRAYLPNRNIVVVDPSRPESGGATTVLAEGKPGREGETVAYVCKDRACSAPMATEAELAAALTPRT
jgi:uncharacterized protein YyaL (SSP411 family)